MKLSAEQQAVVRHAKGPAMVVAGPGTGKTTTLLQRVKYLIRHEQVPAKRILLLTFSSNTEDDLKQRLQRMGHFDDVETRTFHSFCLALIKQHYLLFGYSQTPVYVIEKGKVKNTSSSIQRALTKRISANRITFNDMLLQVARLIQKDGGSFQRLIENYQHILVDEVQDLNDEQTTILLSLAQSKTLDSLVMVGDCKQLIYGFRGASLKHWEALSQQPKPKRYTLTITHRLTKASLGLVNAIGKKIAPNDPPLKPAKDRKAGLKPRFKAFTDFDRQAEFIAANIKQLFDKGVSPDQIACLAYPIMNLKRLEMALDQHGIPTQVIKGSYSSKKTHKDSLDPAEALVQLLKLTQAMQKLGLNPRPNSVCKQFRKHALTLTSALCALGIPDHHITCIREGTAQKGLSGITIPSEHAKLYRKVHQLKQTLTKAIEQSCPEAAAAYLITAIKPFLPKKGHERHDYQMQLITIKINLRSVTWSDAVFSTSLLLPKSHVPKEGIQLCNSHSAKGKEWDYVFLIDLVKGMFPHHAAKHEKHKAEDLRVFYVSITRHKKRLYLLQSPVPIVAKLKIKKRNQSLLQAPSPYVQSHVKYVKVLE